MCLIRAELTEGLTTYAVCLLSKKTLQPRHTYRLPLESHGLCYAIKNHVAV